jgi:putative ABC transport system permease protein
MNIHSVPARQSQAGHFVSLRLALRELRGGLHGFYVFIACIALGIFAIAGIGALSDSLATGLSREGRVILGGDIAFSLIHREANDEELAFFRAQGRLSSDATLRAMARTNDGRAALVEVKAVDGAYPLYGAAKLDPQMPLAEALATHNGVYGAAADPALMARLDLVPGSRILLGNARIEIRAALVSEPDKLAGGIGFGPRLLIGEEALRATGLLQPGSLVRWHYRLRLPDNDASDRAAHALADAARAKWPQTGLDIRTRDDASPQLSRNIERFTQFLTIVGLTALLIGGVGVANAVRSHLERKRTAIAAMKALGATGGRIFTIYLTQVLLLAAFSALIGMTLGACLPFAVSFFFGTSLPLPLAPTLNPAGLALALLYGLLIALAFAIWPLGRAHDISVSELFRDGIAEERRWPRLTYVALTIAAIATLAAVSVTLAYDRRIALIFVFAAAATFVALRLVAALIMAVARRMPHARMPALRLAIANIHRPGALTPSVVLSLGLGLALLVTVVEVDGNLRRQFLAALPEHAPAFYFLDIPPGDAARFDALVREKAPDAMLEQVPMLRGRIVALNGVNAADLKPAPNAAWVLQSDRGITYAGEVPIGSRVVAGEWWGPDYQGPPLVSMEKRIADGFGLKVGDTVTINLLGRNVTATIANLRSVEWQSLGINFVLVYSPNAFRGAPQMQIATLTYPRPSTAAEENALLRTVADAFPAITVVRVKDALAAAGQLIGNLVLALRLASVVTLLAAMLVLGGALAASHRYRVYDAVILRTLGGTRGRLMAAYGLEYGILGAATAIFGGAAGAVAAFFILTRVMNLSFVFLPWPALVAALGALAVTLAFGLIGTFNALSRKPAPVLRHL